MIIVPGQYNEAGWGMDIIGVQIDREGRRFNLYNFECKFVLPGGSPKLGTSSAGIQLSVPWQQNAADRLFELRGQNPIAAAAIKELEDAVRVSNGGRYVAHDVILGKLRGAPAHIVHPDYAKLEHLLEQVRALRRLGRLVGMHGISLPKR
jgi:hypothetical protein